MQRCIRALISGNRFYAMITRVLVPENVAQETAERVQRSRSIRHASAFSIDLGHRLGCAVRTASFFMQPGATPTHVEDVNCRVKCGLQVVFP